MAHFYLINFCNINQARFHIHFCTQSLGTCRLVLWSGLDAGSVVLFDSGHGGQIPFEGVISEGPAVRIQFITDQPNHNTGFNIRYEGTDRRAKVNLQQNVKVFLCSYIFHYTVIV